MTIRTLSLSLVLVLAAGGAALAQVYDGDGNPVPGASSFAVNPHAYAARYAPRRSAPVYVRYGTRYPQLDGDGNPIPGR